jgi:hypothetical protein
MTTIVESLLQIPPTSTIYLSTVTTTRPILCGGCHVVVSRISELPTLHLLYTTTITLAASTATDVSCVGHTKSMNASTFSGSCRVIDPAAPTPSPGACPNSLMGIEACPYSCEWPFGEFPGLTCSNEDFTGHPEIYHDLGGLGENTVHPVCHKVWLQNVTSSPS